MNNSSPRILIVYPYPSIDTNPTMSFLLESLAGRDVEVDVLHEEGEGFLQPSPFGDNVHLIPLPSNFWRIEQLPSRFPRRNLKNLFTWYARQACGGSLPKLPLVKILGSNRFYQPLDVNSTALKLLVERQHSVIIGVDPFGVTFADYLNRWVRKPLVYISFELMLSEELASGSEKNLKRMESLASERTSLLLIQDHERAEVFCRDNAFPQHKVVKVPVAPPPRRVTKSNHLRETLGIPPETRIVLYSGALEAWASRDQLTEMVSHWPENYCLVIHSRSKVGGRMAQFLRRLTETKKIYISTEPVARERLPGLVASADFGLAPYKPVPENWWTGGNLFHLGLASGKVSYYAMCGLPILARSLPVFDREFANYKCGKVYRRLAETGEMLTEMDENYTDYSSESRRFYVERLNPTEGMHDFCTRLIRLTEAISGVVSPGSYSLGGVPRVVKRNSRDDSPSRS